tara:strand:- start:1162 stop:1398 length:237 start_codon:yes stop_codon:yes gene_type:complete
MKQTNLDVIPVGRLVRYYNYNDDGRITSAGYGIVLKVYETYSCYGDNALAEILIDGGLIKSFAIKDLQIIDNKQDDEN